jgi:hypothetical protein
MLVPVFPFANVASTSATCRTLGGASGWRAASAPAALIVEKPSARAMTVAVVGVVLR